MFVLDFEKIHFVKKIIFRVRLFEIFFEKNLFCQLKNHFFCFCSVCL